MLSIYVWIQHTKPHTEHKAVRRFASLFPKRGPDKNTTPTCVGFALNVIACTSCRASASSSSIVSHSQFLQVCVLGCSAFVCMRILLFIENANEIQKQNHSRRVYWKRKPKQSALLWVDDDVACFAVWYVGCWHQVCDGAMPSIVNSFPANNEKIFLCSANCFFVMVSNFLKLIFSIKNISDRIASKKLNLSMVHHYRTVFHYLNLIKMQKMSYFKLVFRLDDWIFSEIKLQTAFLNRITLINS